MQEELQRILEDPILFCIAFLDFHPTFYQERLLRDASKRIVVRWARQSGKTWTIAAKVIWYAVSHPSTLCLIVAPGQRQSMILSDKIQDFLNRLPKSIRRALVEKAQRTVITFRNGSKVIALPNSENLLRGYTAEVVVCEEASFFKNDEVIFDNILTPMLATTDGTLIVSSTPWGKSCRFYEFNQNPQFSKHHVDWRDAWRARVYKVGFLREIGKIARTRPEKYQTEYLAEFAEDIDTWLTKDLLGRCVNGSLNFIDFRQKAVGRFYCGVDFGKAQDYSVVSAVQQVSNNIRLVLCHRFPLGTNYASVIGFLKALSDNWRSIAAVYADQTGVGDYIVEDMKRAGIPNVQGVTFTQASKENMANILRDRMMEGLFEMPYDLDILDELNVEKYELSKTGHIQFSHPSGTNDDRFWSTALAAAAAVEQPAPTRPISRSF